MVDKTEITRPIQIEDNSKERVAFDLMEKIASREYGSSMSPNKPVADEQKSRDYWFKLYSQCLKATQGYEYNSIVKD